MSIDKTIRTKVRESCFLCEQKGQVLFDNLSDQLFSAPGKWNISRCPNCNLIWLNPYPIPEDTHLLYSSYYTHQNIKRNVLTTFLDSLENGIYKSMGYNSVNSDGLLSLGKFIPFFNEYTRMKILSIKQDWGKRILDVGSGNGEFLNMMQGLGWHVEGTEVDPKAAEFSKNKYGLKIHIGDLISIHLESETFDVITLNHVIEHVHDPELLLKECKRILKKGGRLVLMSPNTESLGFRLFKKHWRGLEIPRHISVFSVSNLGILAERLGFKIETLTSNARISRYLYSTSVHIRQGRQSIGGGGNRGYWLALKSYLFQIIEEFYRVFNRKIGEEIFLVAIK